MNRRLLAIALLVACCVVASSARAAEATIVVAADKSEAMPYLFRTGVFTFEPLLPAYPLHLLVKDVKPGTVEIDIGRLAFEQTTDAQDVMHRVSSLVPDLKTIHAAGGEPVLALTRVPLWLSSNPGALQRVEGDNVRKANVSPPRDSQAWRALVRDVARTLREELGFSVRYKVGWEPDQASWQGTEAQFFTFYRDSAIGVREGDASARVGGPSVSALYNARDGAPEPMLARFIRYCASTPAPELRLQRLPLDFLIWHQFESDFLSSWSVAASQARQWLKAAGYPANTELLIGEWSSWRNWPQSGSPEHDGPFLASYIISALDAMDRAGIQRAAFTSLLEQREEEGREFIGSFGLLTNHFIRKPAYWAFKSLAMLGEKRFTTRSTNPLVVAIAGVNETGQIAVAIAYHPLPESLIARSVLQALLGKGYSMAELRKGVHDIETVSRLVRGELNVESLSLPRELAANLAHEVTAARTQLLASQRAMQDHMTLTVRIEGAGGPKMGAALYRIDSTHTNPLTVRRRIEDTVQQRLRQEKERLAAGLTVRLQQHGYAPRSIELLKKVLAQSDKEQAIQSLPERDRRQVFDMMQDVHGYVSDVFAGIAQDIDEWPEVRMNAAEEPRVTTEASGATAVSFGIEPHSVALLKLKRR